MKRSCGVLLPVTSLPSPYGIGGFSKEAYDFVDFLAQAGQSYWQILPAGQTGPGDSPYQSFSTFAGNPYYIDVRALIEAGYISEEEARGADAESDPRYVDYEKVYTRRFALLRKAYENSPFRNDPKGRWAGTEYDGIRDKFESFMKNEKDWLSDYALFCAVKELFGGKPYLEWDEDIRLRKPAAMVYYSQHCAQDIRFFSFLQFLFSQQWAALKSHAQKKGVRFIGDIPIYVAIDSADTWSHPELFELDEKGYPTAVAGCPPDAFSATGQLWGNPLYRWENHLKDGYEWWAKRLGASFRNQDVVRIDHFRGFDEFWAVPAGSETAQTGKWEKGPGYFFFETMEKKLGKREIIAEDLGFLTPSVLELVKKTGYPGMKVLQFAFVPWEDNDYLPHNYGRNCVVYTGTHDNDTIRGWYGSITEEERRFAAAYAGVRNESEVSWDFIRVAMASVAKLAIIPIQDYLGVGKEGRINTPSTKENNWKWRILPGELTKELAARMREMAETYRRIPK